MILVAAIAAVVPMAGASAETLDNAAVIAMTRAGLGDEVIVAKVRGSANIFELSTDQIIALKGQGVSAPVLAAMITASTASPVSAAATMSADSPDPKIPHPSGIYMLADDASRMIRMDPTTANQTKTGGIIGYALTAGIASVSLKSVIPNTAARVSSAVAKPTFYFYFDEANRSLSGGAPSTWLAGPASPVTSPSEFSLIRFDVKKARREARVGSLNIAGAKTGVMDKDRIAFTYDQVVPGVFRVIPEQPLPAGEYGFLYSLSGGGGGGGMLGGAGMMTARVFDFGVK